MSQLYSSSATCHKGCEMTHSVQGSYSSLVGRSALCRPSRHFPPSTLGLNKNVQSATDNNALSGTSENDLFHIHQSSMLLIFTFFNVKPLAFRHFHIFFPFYSLKLHFTHHQSLEVTPCPHWPNVRVWILLSGLSGGVPVLAQSPL